MIRSPISSEERLKNRVEALEDRVDTQHAILEIFYGLLCGTAHGAVETAKRVDDLDRDVEDLACRT